MKFDYQNVFTVSDSDIEALRQRIQNGVNELIDGLKGYNHWILETTVP